MRQVLTAGTQGNQRVEELNVESVAYLSQVIESVSIVGTPISSTTNINISSGSLYYYTANATANWTVNITDTGTLNSMLEIGQSVTVVTLVTQGATPYYNTTVQVDGSSVTPKWINGDAPTAGEPSGIDVYSYTVIKTAASTFAVLASLNSYS